MTDNLSKERDPERRLRIPWSRGVHTLNECLPSTICTVIGCHHIVLFIFKKKKLVDRLFTVILMSWEMAIKIFIPHRGSSLIHRIHLKNCYT